MALHISTGKYEKGEGFAYIALLAVLAILVLAVTLASESIYLNAKREREQQLFFVGEQFRNAIASYNSKSFEGKAAQFPKSLDDLLKDKRFIKPIYHLRRIYRDPMTRDLQWGLVKNGQQQIVGVYSLSTEPVLITNFDANLVKVDVNQNALIYSDLKFIYTPEKIK